MRYTVTSSQPSSWTLPLLAEIMAVAFTAADSEKPWDKDRARAYLDYYRENPNSLFLVAYDQNNNPVAALVGNVKPWRTEDRINDIGLFVHPQHQKKGIGKMLIKRMLEIATQNNVAGVEFTSFAAEQFPLTWFKKAGAMPDTHAVLVKGNVQEILKNF